MMSAFFYIQPKVINLCYKIIKLVLLEILRGVQIDVPPPPHTQKRLLSKTSPLLGLTLNHFTVFRF